MPNVECMDRDKDQTKPVVLAINGVEKLLKQNGQNTNDHKEWTITVQAINDAFNVEGYPNGDQQFTAQNKVSNVKEPVVNASKTVRTQTSVNDLVIFYNKRSE